MSVANIPSNQPIVPLYNTTGTGISDALGMQTMSPEDIMNYVRSQLGNIDAQMADYKANVEARQKRAEELREAMALIREMKAGNGTDNGLEAGEIGGHFDHEKYNRLMTLLGKNSDDPSIKNAYEMFLNSYGGYHATETFNLPGKEPVNQGDLQGIMAGDSGEPYLLDENGTPRRDASGQPMPNPDYRVDTQDCILDADETQAVMDNTKQGLESINSDNEMVMMELQKLMQQRNQITQFASNAMNLDNETKKSVIGNIR
jgi:hypothetical protein